MADPKVEHLLRELRGRFTIPRQNAAKALVEMGAEVVPEVAKLLDSKKPDVQEAAIDVLTSIGTPDALAIVEGWQYEQQHSAHE